MDAKTKIVVGMLAGLIAGVMLVGTAVAVPRMMTAASYNGYAMMRLLGGSGASGGPSIAEMNRFMDGYRTPDGSIDFNRMHADVTNGNVTPPCLARSADAQGSPAMMVGYGGHTGYGMMGSIY